MRTPSIHRLLPSLLTGLLLSASLVAAQRVQAQDAPQKLSQIQLSAGMHLIHAEVARTEEQRAIGLMHRPILAANDGMLFVFDRPGVQCFWMKNTLIPLSIAFIADDGSIVNIAEMKPQSLDSHCSAQPVRLALEMNSGWFAKRGIASGAKVGGIAK
ncbi:MAG: hypothetical protein RLZZ598_1807 [Pseudomonadota bacterium]|jgi:uncharacterized protein